MGRSRWRGARLGAGAALVFALLLSLTPAGVGAQTDDDATIEASTPEQQLADRYAPVVMIKQQTGPCDTDGEAFQPSSVDIVLDNPEVLLRQVGRSDPVMMAAPSAADLFQLGEGFYLDFPGQALTPGCIYERDFDKFAAGTTPTVYAHVARQADRPNQIALQYWFYWYYNDWNNKHESDWEGIQLLFDVGTVEEALATEPVSVGYAQHEGGELAAWDAGKLERDGSRPVVYASAGSHASYFGSALYLGRSASEGFGCDNTDSPSLRVDPEAVVLPDSVDDPDDPLAWLSFEGRWGERQNGAFNGPTGPASKDRWTQPIDWHDELRANSAVVPSGDTQADQVVSGFCGVVEWGSGELIKLTTTPVRFLITLAVLFAVGLWAARRTIWTSTEMTPLVRRRRAGQIIRTAVGIYRRPPRALVMFGLVYLPTTFVLTALARLALELPAFRWFVDVAADVGGARMILRVSIAVLAGAVPYIAVNAMVASYYRPTDGSTTRSASHALRDAWASRRPLLGGFARSVLVVLPLAVTIVGLPWALRQYVRYQFMPQVVMVDRLDGRTALARSSTLVHGRWWHTAWLVAIFNLMIAGGGFVIGLLLLIVLAGLPFWLFSALIALVLALIVPLAAVAQTLLFGDAVAEHDRAADGEAGSAADRTAPVTSAT